MRAVSLRASLFARDIVVYHDICIQVQLRRLETARFILITVKGLVSTLFFTLRSKFTVAS